MENLPQIMSSTRIVAAMGFACLSTDGLAHLAGVESMDVHNIVTCPLSFNPNLKTRRQLTNWFAGIGLFSFGHLKDGKAVGWRSAADQQGWFRKLEKLPSEHRTR